MKRESLSSNIIEFVSHARVCVMMLAFLFLISSCNNLRNPASISGSGNTNNLATPNSGTGGSFTITGVYASQQAPGSLFDVVSSDGQFDVFCTGSYAPCVCEVKYNSPGIGEVINQGAVTYQETNLIRCQNVVQGGISSFELKVVSTGTGDHSNSIIVNMSSGGFVNTTYVDLSQEDTYVDVKRFQCRKREFIANPFNNSIIDPIQSEDPKLIYPFNYYTTNVSNSLWALQNSGTQNWECTLNPNSTNSLQWWANPVVFSAAACPSSSGFCGTEGEHINRYDSLEGGKVKASTFSSAKGKKRSSFSLSKTQYGVFDMPVRASVGPSTVSGSGSYETSTFDVIGYAARSIPVIGGTSSCPTSVAIPSNAHWVKLWNFRANDITAPSYVRSSAAMTASGIACNPLPDGSGNAQKVFPSCYLAEQNYSYPLIEDSTKINSPWRSVVLNSSSIASSAIVTSLTNNSSNFSSTFLSPANSLTTLTSRVGFLTSDGVHACYNIARMSDGSGAGGTPGKPVELWQPSAYAGTYTVDSMKNLPWNIYNAYALNSQNLYLTKACVDGSSKWLNVNSNNIACNSINNDFYLKQSEPFDNLGANDLGKFTQNNYSDHLFVVTDPSVNDTAMINSTQTDNIPVTYRTMNDCKPTSDADTQSSLGCNGSKKLSWGVSVQAIDNPTGPIVYPLCVLQFAE